MIKRVFMPVLTLLALCLVIAAAVSVTNYFTADKIAEQAEVKITEHIGYLLPGTVQKLATECDAFTYYDCIGAADETLGRVYLMETKGYGGPISLMVGLKSGGGVAGISILSSSETPGLGKKIENEAFYGQFAGRDAVAFTVVKGAAAEDDQISAISGATKSSEAITDAVNAALLHFKGGGN